MEKSPFKYICVCCVVLMANIVTAQELVKDANGRPIFARQYTDVQGSPYFSDSWLRGDVKLANGESYKNMNLMYDQVSDELLFKNSKNETMSFKIPVSEFRLINTSANVPETILFRRGYKPADGNTEKDFYQVLCDGETLLLKRWSKKVVESKPYSSASVIKTFEQVQVYYLVKGGIPVRFRREKKALLEVLSDYSSQLANFIESNNLNLKTEAGLMSLVAYYNSLK